MSPVIRTGLPTRVILSPLPVLIVNSGLESRMLAGSAPVKVMSIQPRLLKSTSVSVWPVVGFETPLVAAPTRKVSTSPWLVTAPLSRKLPATIVRV